MSSGCFECIKNTFFTFIILALCSVELVFAIVGSVILSNTNEAIHEKADVWIYVLVQVILKYCCSLGIEGEQTIKTNSDGSKDVSHSGGTVSLADSCIAIWGLVIYFQIKPTTKDFYLNEYPSLWLFLESLAIYHLICFTLSGIL